MPTLKSYPHYEVNVKDNSIQTVTVEEILPVHRPLWILPTQEGPVGEPVWCESASKLKKIFGEQTLNLANPRFASRQAFFLANTMTYNGAFVVRALPSNATYATAILSAEVTDNYDIPQYETDEEGNRLLDMEPYKITYTAVPEGTELDPSATYYVENNGVFSPIDISGLNGDDTDPQLYTYSEVENPNYGEYKKSDDTVKGLKIEFKVRVADKQDIREGLDDLTVRTVSEVTPPATVEYFLTEDATPVEGKTYYIADASAEDGYTAIADASDLLYFETTDTYATAQTSGKTYYKQVSGGYEAIDAADLEAAFEGTVYEKRDAFPANTVYEKKTTEYPTQTTKSYPILAFKALNPGQYGNDLAFRLFYKKDENNGATVAYNKTVFNSLSVVRREYNNSTTNIIFDIFGRTYNTFSADPDSADPESGIKNDMDSVLTNAFDTDNENGTDLPYTIYTYEENLKEIGLQILDVETASGDEEAAIAKCLGFEDLGLKFSDAAEFAESVQYLEEHPFMINVLGGSNPANDPYTHVKVVGLSADDSGDISPTGKEGTVKLDPEYDIFLDGGSDGSLENSDGGAVDAIDRDRFVDMYTYKFLKLKINDKIVDKFRYPFTHLYDPGFTMTTKYAMIDFLDTRDDVMVELATQVLFPNGWVTGTESNGVLIPGIEAPIKDNDASKDIAVGLVLRERALLVRESILKGTDCMRCAIYGHDGLPISATFNSTVPFTFWSAMKHAQYGNTDQMSATEPRGLPYSYNELFRRWNWINYNENIKEKTWNAGVNYCQYADMKRIFYPALRTVYREETSVLVDQWVVDSLVYTKHELRKAWAKFSGRNDRRAILEGAIKQYLEDKLAYLYNGKYDFTVQVYKTIKDIDPSASATIDDEISYIERVRIRLSYPDTMRVMIFDIEVNHESQGSEE